MGKRKNKIKFIDKKQAISFHLVAKASPGDDGADEVDEEQEELDRELAQQKAERRKAMGLASHEEMKGEDDDEEDEDEGSFIPKEQPDDRINILNLAAAAEGIETRAVRQAKKLAKETKQQQFYLQPNFKPGSNVQIPKDFPQEYLYMGNGEDAEDEYWQKQDQLKYDLKKQATAPSLFPHNYDYDKHLRPMTGRGVFMEAKRGDDEYDPETDLRFQPNGSSSSEPTDKEEAPIDPTLFASVEAYQRALVKSGRRVKPTKDFVKALEGEEQEEEFEELQDDFVVQAMLGGGADDGEEDAEAEEGEYYEDGEGYYEEYDEEYEEQGEDEQDEDGDDIPRTLTQKKRTRKPTDEDEDGEDDGEDDEDEDDEEEGDELDAAFNKVLEEYDDDEIGELDHYMEEDPEAMEGNLDLEQIESVFDEYLTQKDKFKSEGGSIIDNVEKDLKELTLNKLALVTAGEKSLEEIEQDLTAMLERPVKESWDAESILSTYSNLSNHPRVLREQRRPKSGSRAPSEAGGSSTGTNRSTIAPFQPALPVPASILRQAKIDAGEDDEDGIDEDGEDGDDDERTNKGKARAQFETPEEKKARKQAVKQAQRDAKERKKALKTLYVQETSAAIAKEVKLRKTNPPGMRKM